MGESPLVTNNVRAEEDSASEGWLRGMAGNLLDTLGNLDDAEFVMSASIEGVVPGVAGGLPTPEPECCCHPVAWEPAQNNIIVIHLDNKLKLSGWCK